MSHRAVEAVREWDAEVEAEHGADAVWVACSHGDVIKAIVADALGLHLDNFQRISVEPCSVSVIRYTPNRPFLLRLGDTGELGGLAPRPAAEGAAAPAARDGDAVVGGDTGVR
jgi:broad specificity phosphatase PhoE